MADVMNVADAVQAAYGPVGLSWWKLHKLLYFCEGWSLAWTGAALFSDRIEAWKNGPVVCEVYRVQKHYPSAARGSAAALTQFETAIVNEVVRFYGRYSAKELIALTHREAPWREARRGIQKDASCRREVDRVLMRQYFGRLKDDSRKIPDGIRRTIDILLASPEDRVEDLGGDAGVDFDAELAYLRGEGPDPWPRSPSQPSLPGSK